MFITILLLIILVLVIATYTDLVGRKIPNWLTFPAMAIAIVLYFINPTTVLWFYLLGLVPALAMYIIRITKGDFGFGDIKLAIFIGLALGGVAPLFVLGVSLVLMVVYKLVQAFVPVGREGIPMAPFFLGSVVIVYLLDYSGIDLLL